MWRRVLVMSAMAVWCAATIATAQNSAVHAPAAGGGSSRNAPTAAPAGQEQLLKSAEAFVRTLFAWGPDFDLHLGPLAQAAAPDFYRVPVEVTYKGQSDHGEIFVSKDGKTMLRGEMFDMGTDPFADNRSKLHVTGNPSTGPDDASVTIVEFSDFECPHCLEFHRAFSAIQAKFPAIKLVYKDFPLTTVHPWAETAAIGARCAFQQSPAAFWKMHDSLFDNQNAITPQNVSEKLTGFATDEGLNADAFKACLSSADAPKAVEANRADGLALGVNSTPTVYVNGRPVVGGDPNAVAQYIEYEMAAHSKP